MKHVPLAGATSNVHPHVCADQSRTPLAPNSGVSRAAFYAVQTMPFALNSGVSRGAFYAVQRMPTVPNSGVSLAGVYAPLRMHPSHERAASLASTGHHQARHNLGQCMRTARKDFTGGGGLSGFVRVCVLSSPVD